MKPVLVLFLAFFCLVRANGDELLTSTLAKIGAHGNGNQKAMLAISKAKHLDHSSILPLLNAMNSANPIGDNWIRAVISETILSSDPANFPIEEIHQFLENQSNAGSSRLTAFELLQDNSPKLANSIIPSLINDREPSLRRFAIAKILQDASLEKDAEIALELYQEALNFAREADQIQEATKQLRNRGETIDLVDLMGFITTWEIVGPFDNSERMGFGKVYSPETETVSSESYTGKNGPTRWTAFSTSHNLGMLDINQEYGHIKEVLAYAKTTFISDKAQKVQVRLGSKNAWKVWVNGDLLYSRDEYHRGKTRIDQFVIDGELKKGANKILLKVCQNEQTQSWTKQWEFCLRITDETGKAVRQSSVN
ncbi:MAG: hypothetical protein VW576_08590 [Opitutae bacterium]